MKRWSVPAVGAVMFLGYAIGYLGLRPWVGPGLAALALIPVAVTSYMGGWRVGLYVGVGFLPFHYLLVTIAETTPLSFERGIAGLFIIVVSGPVAGALGDAQRRHEARSEELEARTGALEAERAFAQHLVEDANAMIVGVDAVGNLRVFNHRAEQVTGLSKAEVLGRPWWERLLPQDRYPELVAAHGPIDIARIPRVVEVPMLTADGSERLISWRLSALLKGERFDGLIGYGVDVTPSGRPEDDAMSPVARAVVREITEALAKHGDIGVGALRKVGRSIAEALAPGTVDEHFSSFQAMGLGRLQVATATGDRLVVIGEDLLEQRLSSRLPTCHLTLGFLEGAVSRASGTETLGTEIQCRSQGAARCKFVVQTRHARFAPPEAAQKRKGRLPPSPRDPS